MIVLKALELRAISGAKTRFRGVYPPNTRKDPLENSIKMRVFTRPFQCLALFHFS